MRLINTSTLELHDFTLSEIPQYAILSHTWSDGEVTFQDMSSPNRSSKKGYVKIIQTCLLARGSGLEFVWVDTCCIDKSSSAELTESINSMFQWYMNAVVCYVSLEDLPPNTPAEDGLAQCRWFTRGWTLQELLAPRTVEFYDMAWNYRGSKFDFVDIISNSTGIPNRFLLGHETLATYSVAKRMSWAACRQTTRVEDMGYCLLGIFGVNMPLIYGEGLKAFRRLQEEIIKRNNDLTIFAWDWDVSQNHEQQILGLFATSPEAFVDSSSFIPFINEIINFSVTNNGLLVSGDVPLRAAAMTREDDREVLRYFLFLGSNNQSVGGIYLHKVGPRLFYRDGSFPLAGFGSKEVKYTRPVGASDCYIHIDPPTSWTLSISSSSFRHHAVHVPFHDIFMLDDAIPETLWDLTDRVFLRPKPLNLYPMAIAMKFRGMLEGRSIGLVVLCDYRKEVPICKVFQLGQYQHEASMIFQGRYRNESIYWTDLEFQAQDLLLLSNCVKIRIGNKVFTISISLEKGIAGSVSWEYELFILKFNIFCDSPGETGSEGQNISLEKPIELEGVPYGST